MRIGIIASSGGASFIAAKKILDNNSLFKHTFFVIVDRDCGLFDYCVKHGIQVSKIQAQTNEVFSIKAAKQLDTWGNIRFSLLFFSRLVTEGLYAKHKLINIHPSFLPKFKGFNAVERALAEKSVQLGATAHLVDESIDGGDIIVQTTFKLTPKVWDNPELGNKISYLQKIWLVLFIVNFIEQSGCESTTISSLFDINNTKDNFPKIDPPLNNYCYLNALVLLQQHENITVY